MKTTLIHGDCIDLMSSLPDGSIDMVLCDLPYGCTRNRWDAVIPFSDLWDAYRRIVKPDGAVVLFASGMFTSNLMASNPGDWRYNLVWSKTTPTGFLNAKRMPLRSHEDICVFYRHLPTYNPVMRSGTRKVSTARHKRGSMQADSYGNYRPSTYDSSDRYPTSVLEFATDKQKSSIHPTQKPVDLLRYLIRTYTDVGQTVIDNCMGSGSTGVACVMEGRCFIGIEQDAKYFEAARKRIRAEAAQERMAI